MSEKETHPDPLSAARDEFIAQWGAMGGAWGINRTMGPGPRPPHDQRPPPHHRRSHGRPQDQPRQRHQNLRELTGWGLIRSVIRKGERKELFEAEKDVWRMFCTVARERQRREIEPALRALHACEAQTRGLRGEKAAAFNRQIRALADFLGQAQGIMERVSKSEQSTIMPLMLRLLGKTLK